MIEDESAGTTGPAAQGDYRPGHHHWWQPGPVVEWSHNGYTGYPGDVPQWRNADMLALVCACGTVRLVLIPDWARTEAHSGQPVDIAP